VRTLVRTFWYQKTVFPQMINWLPELETMRIAFANAVARLGALGVV
jgi:hypothetical protein